MINSEKLKKVSVKLAEIEKIIGYLGNEDYIELTVECPLGSSHIRCNISPEGKAIYDFTEEIKKAFVKLQTHLEHEVRSLVRH